MIPGTMGGSPSKARGSRLEILFSEVALAVEEGRWESALRLADRACRIVSNDPTCVLMRARLLTQLGASAEAAKQLKGRDDPGSLAARMEALCAQGAFDDAAATCNRLLLRYALETVETLDHMAGQLCRMGSCLRLPGWVGIDSSLRLVGEVRTGSHLQIECGGSAFYPASRVVGRDGFDWFWCQRPSESSGRLVISADNLWLLGSGIAWPLDFGVSGWVAFEHRALVGEVRLEWAPRFPVELVIGKRDVEYLRMRVAPEGTGSSSVPFSIPLERWNGSTGHNLDDSPVKVSVVLPDGTSAALTGSPVRTRPVSPTPVGVRPTRTICGERRNGASVGKEQHKPPIDIVVPVHSGFDETLSCLERVLESTNPKEAHLVAVDDASPNASLREALARLATDGRITLLKNPTNQGFAGAANRGLRLHPERDIVLLNADTEVYGDWLDRLHTAAFTAEDIGTVTPLGEVASIATYPGKTDRASTRMEAVEIDDIAREVNARNLVELPVGVGFCLYIKRACLAEVGSFDESSFAKGYGEENDFCLRARRLGWRHVAATDLFVRHRGGRSYGHAKKMLIERNRRVLNNMHPGYDTLISDFAAADPLLDARRAIDMRRLVKKATNPVLLMTLDLSGGVQRHVDLRSVHFMEMGHTVLVLKPSQTSDAPRQVIVRVPDSGTENLVFKLPHEAPVLRNLLLGLRLQHVEIHHFVGIPESVLELVVSLGFPYDVYIHDYSWICPRATLVGGSGIYCGEPPVEDCERCILAHGTLLEESLTVRALRARSASILQRASAVIAPSHDVRSRVARYFPGLAVEVIPWEEPIRCLPSLPVAPSRGIRVGVIGAISIQKGYQVLLECARDAVRRNLDLEFVVIGYTHDDESLLETGRVFITGPYRDREVDALLAREQCHVSLFPGVGPETWCYALTHVLNKGLPIVAFDLGGIAERLREYRRAKLLPLSTPIVDINRSLLEFAREIHTSESERS